jgi:hypothetical protein
MRSLAVAGLGNIGLNLANFLPRLPGIDSIVLADPDVFTPGNVSGQLVSPRELGRAKVDVAAARIAAVNPSLRVDAFQCRLEHVPRALLGGCVLLTCLDTRLARAHASTIADGGLFRVSVMGPALAEAACLCCGWSDWNRLAQEFSCAGSEAGAPTAAPAYLGAAAAALAAHLLDRYLGGDLVPAADVASHTLSLNAHRAWITKIRRGVGCRCGHQRWTIGRLGRSAAECQLGSLAGEGALALPGMPFVRRLRCVCGARREMLRVAARVSAASVQCDACGRPMSFGPIDLIDELDLSALDCYGPGAVDALALAGLAIRDGDVIRLGERYFEVGASAQGRGL